MPEGVDALIFVLKQVARSEGFHKRIGKQVSILTVVGKSCWCLIEGKF